MTDFSRLSIQNQQTTEKRKGERNENYTLYKVTSKKRKRKRKKH